MTRVFDHHDFRDPYGVIRAGRNTALLAAVDAAVSMLEADRHKAERCSKDLGDGWMAIPAQAALETWLVMWRYDPGEDALDLRLLTPWPESIALPAAYSRGPDS